MTALSQLLPSLRNKTVEDILLQINKTKSVNKEQQIRLDKKLWVGNLPPGITKEKLLDCINKALEQLKLN